MTWQKAIDMPETIWDGSGLCGETASPTRRTEYVLRSSVQGLIDAAERRGMQKAIETIDANISPCHAPGLWADDERHAYLRGQIDASVSFIHSIRLSSAKIGGAVKEAVSTPAPPLPKRMIVRLAQYSDNHVVIHNMAPPDDSDDEMVRFRVEDIPAVIAALRKIGGAG